jgi:hypothetical protein
MASIPKNFVGNQSGFYTRDDGSAPWAYDGTTMVYQGYGPVTTYSSGNVANATASATIPAVAARTCYISGFEVTGAGATVGGVVSLTITGLLGGTATYSVTAPTGATVGLTPLVIEFNPPLPASAANTAIVVSLPALGAGNTNAAVVAHGFSL